jgi:hypothetical protein
MIVLNYLVVRFTGSSPVAATKKHDYEKNTSNKDSDFSRESNVQI